MTVMVIASERLFAKLLEKAPARICGPRYAEAFRQPVSFQTFRMATSDINPLIKSSFKSSQTVFN